MRMVPFWQKSPELYLKSIHCNPYKRRYRLTLEVAFGTACSKSWVSWSACQGTPSDQRRSQTLSSTRGIGTCGTKDNMSWLPCHLGGLPCVIGSLPCMFLFKVLVPGHRRIEDFVTWLTSVQAVWVVSSLVCQQGSARLEVPIHSKTWSLTRNSILGFLQSRFSGEKCVFSATHN